MANLSEQARVSLKELIATLIDNDCANFTVCGDGERGAVVEVKNGEYDTYATFVCHPWSEISERFSREEGLEFAATRAAEILDAELEDDSETE